jgi:hypothetical protein
VVPYGCDVSVGAPTFVPSAAFTTAAVGHVFGTEPLAAVVPLPPAAVVPVPAAVVPLLAVVGDVEDALDFAPDDPHAARSTDIVTTTYPPK